MGWSAATAIRMAKRYGHIGSKALREAAEVLGSTVISAHSLKKFPRSPEVQDAGVQQTHEKNGSSGRTRTYNPPVNSRMLCH
jgi:hypothetical protein